MAAARQTPVFHFVPDELCVVLTCAPRAGNEVRRDSAWQGELYEAVRAALDRALRAELPRAAREERSPEPFRRDLAPRRLGAIVGRDRRLLWDLREGKRARPIVADDPRTREPWVLLPRADGALTALLFFGIGAEGSREDPFAQEVAREAVNLCNRAYRRRALPLPPELDRVATVRIETGTPNWLIGASPHGEIGGGPGSGPEPVSEADATMLGLGRFSAPGNAALAALIPGPDRAPHTRESARETREVVVAVLDTCPTDGKKKIAAKLAALKSGDHWLLRELGGSPHVHLDEHRFVGAGVTWNLTANWGRWSDPDGAAPRPSHHAQHAMPDHGLFAAGIVRTLAPGAELHLIRVLDDNGVGDLLALAHTLARLPEALLGERPTDPPGPRRLVVNLSLTADIPPDAALLDLWFPETADAKRHPEALRGRITDICATLGAIQLGLRAVVEWLAARGNVLLVAAAGNEGQHAGGRPAPAAPARYDSVLGVGALRADGGPARFSNRADIAVFGNGVAVFGGNVAEDATGDLGVIDMAANGQPDAVVGAAIADDLPPQGVPNDTGWARWAGTSFAAPIVSGLAAALWSDAAGRGLAAPALLGALVALGGAQSDELDVPALAIAQVR